LAALVVTGELRGRDLGAVLALVKRDRKASES
jgi:hypothetical protein